MSLASRSPASRKSLSLSEHDMNLTMPVTSRELKGKKRVAMSVGGEGLEGVGKGAGVGVGFQLGEGGVDAILSPRRRERRNKQPRKSILKSLSSSTLREEETMDFGNQQYAHTIAFSSVNIGGPRPSLAAARRVSFAPNAHVRMFANPPTPIQLPAAPSAQPNIFSQQSQSSSGPRSSIGTAHSRRSSIQNLSHLQHGAQTFQGEGEEEGEASMDIESDSEDIDDDEDGQSSGQNDGGNNLSYPGAAQYGDEEDADGEEVDEDGDEVDMDETQVIYGGIMRRQSTIPRVNIEEVGDISAVTSEGGNDEEKTMDFTIAIGGVIPHSPPVNATHDNRSSIGYSLPGMQMGERLIPGQTMEGDMELEMEMEETIAIGGIIGGDESLSSSGSASNGGERTMTFSFGQVQHQADGDGEDEMEMTVAHGGIFSSVSSKDRRTSSNAGSTPGRPTPSFARPTVSSAQKSQPPTTSQKRNVFAPSPSPYKSTSPRKSVGMAAAGEVAKRLSFGSVTSSGGDGRKRGREEDGEAEAGDKENVEPSPKRRNTGLGDSVFGTSAATQRSTTPSRSPGRLGTPSRPAPGTYKMPTPGRTPRGMLGQASPFRRTYSQELIQLNNNNSHGQTAADDDVEEIPRDGDDEVDSPPTISLAAFLEMTGVSFLESLPGVRMGKRRSSVGRGRLGQGYVADRDFALHEYAEAQVHHIFLNMYSWAAEKMQSDVLAGSADLMAQEESCNLMNPPVIREYLSATDDEKDMFEMTFKSFKTNTMLKARERWYDWKMGLMGRVRPDIEDVLRGGQEDEARLDEMTEQATALLPELQARAEALQAELKREREVVAEVAACDQEELADLKAAIAEQASQIQGFTSELSDSTTKLDALEGKLAELSAKKQEHQSAIALAKSRCDQFTRSDVARLREEYTSLQHLHLWRPNQMAPTHMHLSYDHEISLTFECTAHMPDMATAQVFLLDSKAPRKGGLPQDATVGLFGLFQAAVRGLVQGKPKSLPSLVQRVGQLWSAAQRLRAELAILFLRHPISFSQPEDGTLVVSATLLFEKERSKAVLEYLLDGEVLMRWPGGLAEVEVRSRVVYGNVDAGVLEQAARDCIGSATAEGYLGAFLQSAVDAVGQYGG